MRQKPLLKEVVRAYFEYYNYGPPDDVRRALRYLCELEPERQKWRFLEIDLLSREELEEEFREAWSCVRKDEWAPHYCTTPRLLLLTLMVFVSACLYCKSKSKKACVLCVHAPVSNKVYCSVCV